MIDSLELSQKTPLAEKARKSAAPLKKREVGESINCPAELSIHPSFSPAYSFPAKNPQFIWRCVFFLLFLLLLPAGLEAGEGEKQTICLYNPEANINNYASLKEQFNRYFSTHGGYRLQPFNERKVFEKYIRECPDCVFLLSSWHFENLKGSLPLSSILRGTFQGKVAQKRIISVGSEFKGFESLRGVTLASASSDEFTRNTLLNMLGDEKQELIDTIKVLTVPKDIDALMSVAFGISSAALTTERSLGKLQEINKIQAEMLNTIPVSGKTRLPIIAVWENRKNGDETKALVDVLLEMGVNDEGRLILSLIGLDGFQQLSKVK